MRRAKDYTDATNYGEKRIEGIQQLGNYYNAAKFYYMSPTKPGDLFMENFHQYRELLRKNG